MVRDVRESYHRLSLPFMTPKNLLVPKDVDCVKTFAAPLLIMRTVVHKAFDEWLTILQLTKHPIVCTIIDYEEGLTVKHCILIRIHSFFCRSYRPGGGVGRQF